MIGRISKRNQKNGITLVALVITVIVLIILAGVTINLTLGQNGLITKSKIAVDSYQNAANDEQIKLAEVEEKMDEYTTGGTGGAVELTKTDGTKLNLSASALKNADGTPNNEELAKVYGTEVKYAQDTDSDAIKNCTWRVFYIDFDNRYGDGAGTVYLKADPIPLGHDLRDTTDNTSNTESYAESSLDLTNTNVNLRNKLWQMNPAYAAACSNTLNTSNKSAKAVAYLNNPARWTQYVNSSANYAIGGPSIEMYCDSYAVFKAGFERKDNTVTGGTTKGWTSCNATGYAVNSSDGNLWKTETYAPGTVDDMYCKKNDCWWLGSPSSGDTTSVLDVHGTWGYLDDMAVFNDSRSVCPLVSLKSKVQ